MKRALMLSIVAVVVVIALASDALAQRRFREGNIDIRARRNASVNVNVGSGFRQFDSFGGFQRRSHFAARDQFFIQPIPQRRFILQEQTFFVPQTRFQLFSVDDCFGY